MTTQILNTNHINIIALLLFNRLTNAHNSWFQTFSVFWTLYAFFWVIPWHLNHSNVLKSSHTSYLPASEDGTECSEMSAHKIRTLGNYPEESIQNAHKNSCINLFYILRQQGNLLHFWPFKDEICLSLSLQRAFRRVI